MSRKHRNLVIPGNSQSLARIILLFALLPLHVYGDKIEKDWVRQDEIFINQLKSAYREDPERIIDVLQPDTNSKTDLGYGYTLVSGSKGKGYVSTFYDMIYFKGRLVSYRLEQQMPDDPRLREKYKNLYRGMFEVINGKVLPTYYHYHKMVMPLANCNQKVRRNASMEFYMTPYSGITYGIRGGEADALLMNRAYYLSIRNKLSYQDHLSLLCSKNPATRLTAIEYLMSHPKNGKNLDVELQDRINKIFSALPEVPTMSGCMVHSDSAKRLVHEFSKQDPKINPYDQIPPK